MKQHAQKILNHPAPKYLMVGVTSLAADYSVLLFLYHLLDAPLVVATTIAYTVGLVSNFLLNKYWTFDAPRGNKHGTRQALLYGVLVAFNLLFTNLFIISFERADIGPEITKPIVTAIITLWNYVLYQKIIFKTHRPTDLERSMM